MADFETCVPDGDRACAHSYTQNEVEKCKRMPGVARESLRIYAGTNPVTHGIKGAVWFEIMPLSYDFQTDYDPLAPL